MAGFVALLTRFVTVSKGQANAVALAESEDSDDSDYEETGVEMFLKKSRRRRKQEEEEESFCRVSTRFERLDQNCPWSA